MVIEIQIKTNIACLKLKQNNINKKSIGIERLEPTLRNTL